MRTRRVLKAMILALALIVTLLSTLAHSTSPARANPSIYYVREGAGGDCLSVTTPCSNVQRAINLASVHSDEVLVAGGVYTENLTITHGVKLRGGWNVSFTTQSLSGAPTILDGGAITHVVRVAGMPQAEIEVVIEGLTLRNGDDGIHAWDGRVTVENCTVQNVAWQGIAADGGAITLTNNSVQDTGGDGIHVDGGAAVAIQGNAVYSAGSDGIDTSGSVIVVGGNTVSGCAGDGIRASAGESARVEVNRVLSNGVGISIHGPAAPITGVTPVFTVANNAVGGHVTASVELTGAVTGLVAHNTLVGNSSGSGLAVSGPVTATIANNIVTSHSVGITATAKAVLSLSHTLLWGNATDPISGTAALLAPPHLAAPSRQDYHLRANSPAIGAGIEIGVLGDMDGDPRSLDASPDVGADEFRAYSVYIPLVVEIRAPVPRIMPVYHLYADTDGLDGLAQDPYLNETIPAVFCAPSILNQAVDRCWDVDVRYRGDTARLMPKKSWKIFFPSSDPFQDQLAVSYELNLNADYVDQTLMRSSICYDLFARAGVPTPRARYAQLYINDDYYGLFLQVEQVDERFLYRHAIEMHGNLYKPRYGRMGLESGDWWYGYHYPKKTNRQSGHQDLVAFIEQINNTPDEQFANSIVETLDVNGWLDWYAVNVLIGNYEMTNKNHYLYHDFSAGRWMILPWDTDITLGHNVGNPYGLYDRDISWDNPIDTGADPSGKHNFLIERMMDVPEFQFYHCRKLTELMNGEFSPAKMFSRIDETYAYIYDAAIADPYRWRPEQEGYPGFEDGPDELKTYIANRILFLEEEMPGFCPGGSTKLTAGGSTKLTAVLALPLTINELMTGDGGGAPWIEIHNASSTLAWDVGEMYLSDVLSEPTKWRFPTGATALTTIPAGGTLLVWTDGDEGQGPLHTNFALEAGGGQIGLFDRDDFGNEAISVLAYTAQSAGVSYGRMPDGSENWQSFVTPTPGWLNQGRPPIAGGTAHTPTWPTAGNSITITTTITGEGAVTATLWYRAFAAGAQPSNYQPAPMEVVGGATYQVVLPGQAEGVWVDYYLEVKDSVGMTAVDRPGWPQGDYRYVVGWQRPPLYINELMAINTHTLEDEAGEADDWLEIYNAGPVDVDLGGMYLSDNMDSDTSFTILDDTIVPAGGHLVLWADGYGRNGHLNFRLSGAGEYVGLFDSRARHYAPVDAAYFPPLVADVSWGRFPDPTTGPGQGGEWYTMTSPTPGAANRLLPPQFVQVTRAPTWPNEGEVVSITAVITADNPVVSVTVWHDVGSGFQPFTMTNDGSDGISWQVVLSPQITGTLVQYYLAAADGVGQITRHPAAAPIATLRYKVGYAAPNVVINEFLADNASVNQDEGGAFADWVELYNASIVTVAMDGMHLTDGLVESQKWQFPPGASIPPGGHLLVWCNGDTGQGPLHTNFRLGRDGEQVALVDSVVHGLALLDWVVFGPQQEDVSYGRRPDGADRWEFFDPPTPGMGNE